MLKGDITEVKNGFCELEKLKPQLRTMDITAIETPGDACIICEKKSYKIYYSCKHEFFRGISVILEKEQENDFVVQLERYFETMGLMVDVSRCGVMTVEAIKVLLLKMSLMGYNMLMLYTEDTYVIEDEPYFGYLRGAYTYQELKECDDFAYDLGIEMIPCIQTLSHLKTFLKWEEAEKYRDTVNTLLADGEFTYTFIEKMIDAASAPFRSKRIHIGMDEAFDLGTGAFLRKNPYKDPYEIFIAHLNKVMEIINARGLEPMMWSDTYIRTATGNDDYSACAPFIRDIKEDIPENMSLCYWDYYHFKNQEYLNVINQHKEISDNVIFCPTVQLHDRITPNYVYAFAAINHGMAAAKQAGIREVINTVWCTENQELDLFYGMPQILLAAEHNYNDEITDETMRKRCRACLGVEYDDYLLLGKPDTIEKESFKRFYCGKSFMEETWEETEGIADNPIYSNVTRYLMWQDVLLSPAEFYAMEYKGYEGTYDAIAAEIEAVSCPEYQIYFDYMAKLCHFTERKVQTDLKITEAYRISDKETLKKIANMFLPDLMQRIEELRICNRKIWFRTYKAYGWEGLDSRYGGMRARLQSAADRLMDYVEGRINQIEELEKIPLPIRSGSRGPGLTRAIEKLSDVLTGGVAR